MLRKTGWLAASVVLMALMVPTAPLHAGSAGGKQKPDIKWGDKVDWKSWKDGSAEAKKSGRPMCLVVYADWCPRCRELAPVFGEDEIASRTEGIVMVLQDSDEKPAWLKERYGEVGGYVPRILFLESDGTLREDLTSGNERYPYYYWPGNEHLAKNLEKLAADEKD